MSRPIWFGLDYIVLIATFNNISVTSWRSGFLVEEIGVPGENQHPVASYWQMNIWMLVVIRLFLRWRYLGKKNSICIFFLFLFCFYFISFHSFLCFFLSFLRCTILLNPQDELEVIKMSIVGPRTFWVFFCGFSTDIFLGDPNAWFLLGGRCGNNLLIGVHVHIQLRLRWEFTFLQNSRNVYTLIHTSFTRNVDLLIL